MNRNLRTEFKSALFSIHIKPASWSRYKILHSKAFQICPYPEPAKWIFTTGTKAWTKTQLFTQACKADKCNYAKRLRMWRLCGRKFSTLDSELVLTLNKVCSLLERSTESEKCLWMNIRCKSKQSIWGAKTTYCLLKPNPDRTRRQEREQKTLLQATLLGVPAAVLTDFLWSVTSSTARQQMFRLCGKLQAWHL